MLKVSDDLDGERALPAARWSVEFDHRGARQAPTERLIERAKAARECAVARVRRGRHASQLRPDGALPLFFGHGDKAADLAAGWLAKACPT